MSDEEQEATAARGVIYVATALIVILIALTLIDMQIKRAIVDQAEQFWKEMGHARAEHRGTAAPDGVPGAVPGLHGLGGVGGDGPRAQEDGAAPARAEVVMPGDESARPPHRGSIDGS
jgi:hypothetical protein